MVPRVFFLPLAKLLLLVLGFEAWVSNTPGVCSATESHPNLVPFCNAIALGFKFQLGCLRDTHIPMKAVHTFWPSTWCSDHH